MASRGGKRYLTNLVGNITLYTTDSNVELGVMMMATTEAPAPSLVFSDSAARKVKSLIEEEDNQALKLRVFITGGGCY